MFENEIFHAAPELRACLLGRWCLLLALAGCAQPEQQSAAALPSLPAAQATTTVEVTVVPRPAPAWPDRSVLPIKVPEPASITELDARKATAPPRFQVQAPAKAPNVVIVLLDDFGFG